MRFLVFDLHGLSSLVMVLAFLFLLLRVCSANIQLTWDIYVCAVPSIDLSILPFFEHLVGYLANILHLKYVCIVGVGFIYPIIRHRLTSPNNYVILIEDNSILYIRDPLCICLEHDHILCI